MDQKMYLAKIDGGAQKPRGRHLSKTRRPFWGPLAAILDFVGSAALQAVSKCPFAARQVLHLLSYSLRAQLKKALSLLQEVGFIFLLNNG